MRHEPCAAGLHRQALAPFVNNPTLGVVDVKETDKAYEFDVDIPGLTKEEVQVRAAVLAFLPLHAPLLQPVQMPCEGNDVNDAVAWQLFQRAAFLQQAEGGHACALHR